MLPILLKCSANSCCYCHCENCSNFTGKYHHLCCGWWCCQSLASDTISSAAVNTPSHPSAFLALLPTVPCWYCCCSADCITDVFPHPTSLNAGRKQHSRKSVWTGKAAQGSVYQRDKLNSFPEEQWKGCLYQLLWVKFNPTTNPMFLSCNSDRSPLLLHSINRCNMQETQDTRAVTQ